MAQVRRYGTPPFGTADGVVQEDEKGEEGRHRPYKPEPQWLASGHGHPSWLLGRQTSLAL